MSHKEITPTRLEAFSDGVIAIIITIMVLELKVPADPTINGLIPLWPVFISYALSYLKVAIYWINHHSVVHDIRRVDNRILWCNMLFLFCISFIPFFTAYMGENEMHGLSTALYAACMLVSSMAFFLLRVSIACHFGDDEILLEKNRLAHQKNAVGMVLYTLAIPVSFWSPIASLMLTFIVAMMYFIPDTWIKGKK